MASREDGLREGALSIRATPEGFLVMSVSTWRLDEQGSE
jgi:hypothetical protein